MKNFVLISMVFAFITNNRDIAFYFQNDYCIAMASLIQCECECFANFIFLFIYTFEIRKCNFEMNIRKFHDDSLKYI